MDNKRTGSCQCGQIRYRLTGEPLTLYLCHCSACQKQSSSAFGMSLRIQRSELEIVSGELKFWHSRADSGTPKIASFCSHCGSRIYHCRSHQSETLNIKAGTLDDTSWLMPVGHLWMASAQPWFQVTDNGLRYQKQPDNYDGLCKKWRS